MGAPLLFTQGSVCRQEEDSACETVKVFSVAVKVHQGYFSLEVWLLKASLCRTMGEDPYLVLPSLFFGLKQVVSLVK